MFPNPAGSRVIIQLDNLNSSTVMNLTNILGQTVASKNLADLQNVIDLTELSAGVYIMQLKQGDKLVVKQLVVSK